MQSIDHLAPHIQYVNDALHVEHVAIADLIEQFGTPLYVYSKASLLEAYGRYAKAFGPVSHRVCYAVKANSNLSLLRVLHDAGAGFDIVSGGELARVLAIGADPERIVFSGVGKSVQEIKQALAAGIGCFNVESVSEMHRIAEIAAALGLQAPVSVRVNPDVDAKTHPYISTGLRENKFGVDFSTADSLYTFAKQHPALQVVGIDCHIGSQLTDAEPYLEAVDRVLQFASGLVTRGITLSHVDFGGGLGIRYDAEQVPDATQVVQAVISKVQAWAAEQAQPMPCLMVEPGRSIVGNAGLLVTQVEYVKTTDCRQFAIVDAAMNDLMRPALYEAFHAVVPIKLAGDQSTASLYDIVGPVCETGDWLAKQRSLSLKQGDYVALLSAGAYGMSMASNYNSRPKPAEVMVQGKLTHLIRRRETLSELFAAEIGL